MRWRLNVSITPGSTQLERRPFIRMPTLSRA
jgi:hypothetical protein